MMGNDRNHQTLLVGVQIGTFSLENTFALFIKVEDMYSLCTDNSTPRYICNKKVYPCAPRDIYLNIHSSIICNIPILETYQKSINSRMDKEIMVCSCYRILQTM